MTLTLIAERLAVELSLSVLIYDLGLSRLGFEHPTFHTRANALTHRATAAVEGACRILKSSNGKITYKILNDTEKFKSRYDKIYMIKGKITFNFI